MLGGLVGVAKGLTSPCQHPGSPGGHYTPTWDAELSINTLLVVRDCLSEAARTCSELLREAQTRGGGRGTASLKVGTDCQTTVFIFLPCPPLRFL